MNKKTTFVILLFSLAAGRAEAANFAVITSPPTLLHLVILAVAVACVGTALKVLALVRGGQLSKSWQYLLAGFSVLALCQLVIIAGALEVIMLPHFVVPVCLVVMSILFLVGIIETKRVLS